MREDTPLSCSTSFFAARNAESGDASEEPRTISRSLPPALFCRQARRSKPRWPSSPVIQVPRASKEADLDLRAADADPPTAATATRTTAKELAGHFRIAFLPVVLLDGRVHSTVALCYQRARHRQVHLLQFERWISAFDVRHCISGTLRIPQ